MHDDFEPCLERYEHSRCKMWSTINGILIQSRKKTIVIP